MAPTASLSIAELFGITIAAFGSASDVGFASGPAAVVKTITFAAIGDPKFGSFATVGEFAGLAASVGACFAVQRELVESEATVVAGLPGEAVVGVGAREAAIGSDFAG